MPLSKWGKLRGPRNLVRVGVADACDERAARQNPLYLAPESAQTLREFLQVQRTIKDIRAGFLKSGNLIEPVRWGAVDHAHLTVIGVAKLIPRGEEQAKADRLCKARRWGR